MKINVPSGYRLVFDEKLDDVNGWGACLEHVKTKAKIAIIKNDDTNKVFAIGFRTPPKNSTGVAHIIEHSVLCGSRNFPAKDTFIELVKGSLNTFLNAMTYADRTVYPVASQNDKDFKNLMHVYMDAVLFPNIYDRIEIFRQEGWHYSLEDPKDELQINGVVYSEMKGAFSSPEQQLLRMNMNSLFPDTAYGVESGGDPDYIPELTYEEFLEFHRTYYHPSNSYIYLYGDMDFEERLEWLDREYLSKFDYLKVDSEIKPQKGFDALKEIEGEYSLGEGDDRKENTYLSLNIALSEKKTKEQMLGFQILEYVLLDAPGAPVKQALLDAGIGKDILCQMEDAYLQPFMSIIAKNSDEDRKQQFISIIRDTLMKQAEEGLNEKSLRGAINMFEFRYREADFGGLPKGLIYGLRVLDSWNYEEEDPFRNLKDNPLFEKMRGYIGTGYFEKMIKDCMLNNNHATLVVLKPKAGLNKLREENMKKKLAAYKESLSEEEIQRIIKDTESLRKYHETPSTKEELETIPLLTRDDIGPDPQPLYNEEKSLEGVRVVHHEVFTNEIAYIKLLFDVKDVPKELFPYLSLISAVLGYIGTENYSFMEYANEVNLHTGGISHDISSYSIKGRPDEYLPMYEISVRVLYNKIPDAFRLIEEVLYRTKLEDYKRLKEILDELKSRMQMIFQSSGHSVAVNRAMSYYSRHAMFKESIKGITFFEFLEDLTANYDQKKTKVVEKLGELIDAIFAKSKLLVSVTADSEGYKKFGDSFKAFAKGLRENAPENCFAGCDKSPLQPQCLNEGFKTAMQVQYVAMAGNYFKAGFEYTGALKVLKTLLSFDYLWQNIRVMGGAYGCMCGFSGVDGDVYFTSYRDPNLKKTLQVYRNIPEYIKKFSADEREITKSILGTISSLDMPLTPQLKGSRSLSMLLSGVTYEDLKKEREAIINLTQEDIRSLSDLVQSVIDEGNICVIGNEGRIDQDKDLFKEVKSLMI